MARRKSAGESEPSPAFKPNSKIYWFIVIIGVAAYSCVELPCADTWWHLAAGRELVNTRHFLYQDPFAFTTSGSYWWNHEWLAEVVFYWAYLAAGLWGVFLLRSLLVTLSFGVLPGLAHRGRGLAAALLPTALLPMAQAYYFLDARAYLWTYFFLSLTLVCARRYLEAGRPLWLMVAIFATIPWANSHGGYILGPVVWLLVSVALLSQRDSRWKPILATFLASMGAALVNPYGYHIWWFPLSLRQDSFYLAHLNEWQPPRLFGPGYLYLFLPVLAGWLLWRRRAARWEWLIAAAFYALGLMSWRHGVLAGVALTHLLTVDLPTPEQRLEPIVRSLLYANVIGLLLVFFLKRWHGGPERWTQLETHFPVATATYLEQHPELPSRFMNPYGWGGYLAWALGPHHRTFIDGRAHTVFPAQVYLDALAMDFGEYHSSLPGLVGQTWEQVLTKYDIDLVLASKSFGRAAENLLAKPNEWTVLYQDADALVFLRKSSRVATHLSESISDAALLRDYLVKMADSPAEPILWRRAVELTPTDVDLRLQFVSRLLALGDKNEAQRQVEVCLGLFGKRPWYRDGLARVFLANNDLGTARALLLEEIRLNPNPKSRELLSQLQRQATREQSP